MDLGEKILLWPLNDDKLCFYILHCILAMGYYCIVTLTTESSANSLIHWHCVDFRQVEVCGPQDRRQNQW